MFREDRRGNAQCDYIHNCRLVSVGHSGRIQSAPYAPWWIKLTPEIIAGLRKPTRRTWSRQSVSSEK